MTSLRTFQTEIEEIHHRELVKQRAQVIVTDKEKEPKILQSKGKTKKDTQDTDRDDVSVGVGMVEVEEKILVPLELKCCSTWYLTH
jgi:hypothetical protein